MSNSAITINSLLDNTDLANASQHSCIVNFSQAQQLVDIGHSKLAYWSVGSGPNLILVHGWPISSATYRNLLPYLSQHFTCHLFDFPGAGKTITGTNAPFGLKAHALSLKTAIEKLGIQDYSLLGHDSGAAIMQFLAELDPGNVNSMVMGNTETPGYLSFMMKFLLSASKLPMTGELLFWSLRFKFLRHSKFGLGCAFQNKTLIDGDFFDLFLKPIISSKETRKGQLQLFKNLDPNEVAELVRIQENCRTPIQLQWGSEDPYFLLKDAKKMEKRFKGESEMHVYEGGKLFVHEEYPEQFAKLATEFILRSR